MRKILVIGKANSTTLKFLGRFKTEIAKKSEKKSLQSLKQIVVVFRLHQHKYYHETTKTYLIRRQSYKKVSSYLLANSKPSDVVENPPSDFPFFLKILILLDSSSLSDITPSPPDVDPEIMFPPNCGSSVLGLTGESGKVLFPAPCACGQIKILIEKLTHYS